MGKTKVELWTVTKPWQKQSFDYCLTNLLKTWTVKKFKAISRGFLHNVNKDSWKLFVGQQGVEDFVRQLHDVIQSTELGNTAEF